MLHYILAISICGHSCCTWAKTCNTLAFRRVLVVTCSAWCKSQKCFVFKCFYGSCVDPVQYFPAEQYNGLKLCTWEPELLKQKVSFYCLIFLLMGITSIITITWVNIANQRWWGWGPVTGGESSQDFVLLSSGPFCVCSRSSSKWLFV